MKKYSVIYDGDCGFCQATVNFVKKLDWLRKFDFIPFQMEGVFEKYDQINKERCKKELFLIKPNGKYYGGYDGFKIMSVYMPLTFLISWFFFLPGITQIGRMIYKIIAENRHKIRIGKKICKVSKH